MLSTKAERMQLYKDRSTQALLSRFLSGEIRELEPVYDPELGYHYPPVEAIVGAEIAKTESFLNTLYDVGILERRLYDKTILCPKCSSMSVSVRYLCPYCKSLDIRKSSLIEHVKCGYMDTEDNFRVGGKLLCPKCHEELKKPDVDYRRAGIWCACKECSKNFDVPVAGLFCRDCHGNFAFEDVEIKDVYAYTMKEEAKKEVDLGWVLIAPIRTLLAENGFEVASPAFLKGKSGANHMFDLVAYRRGAARKVIVIDLATSTEAAVLEQPVIALFAKMFDVSPDLAFLIAFPKMSENGKKMAKLYKIQIIEARDQKEATGALKERILGV